MKAPLADSHAAADGATDRPRSSRRSRALRGNLNAAKHPWRSYWRRRALRREDRWIAPLVANYAETLAADKGGAENMSAAEMRMVELAQLARGCTLLVLAAAANEGGLVVEREGPDLPSSLARFMNVERQCLQALGLERRARPVPSLREYLEARAVQAPGQDPAPA